MAVTMETIALAVKLSVLGIGKSSGMQAVRSIEWHLHSKKDSFVIPYFRKKIGSFVQAYAMQLQIHTHVLVDITCEAFSRYRAIL